MKRVAKFEKVSSEQFQRDWSDTFNDSDNAPECAYDKIKLPQRATTGSAGYDFFSPLSFTLYPQQTIKIPTGIRVKIFENWVLQIYPRSSLGFKYRLQLDNTVGIIDSDYYNAKNEGHIFIKVTNTSQSKILKVEQGDAFAQGIFMEYGITTDDNVETQRIGGIGSTNKKAEK